MKYAFYADPQHGWLKVSVQEIDQLAILQEISSCSYISADGKYAFLEEDQDAQLFFNAVLAADWFQDFDAIRRCTAQYHSNFPSFIRNLDSFSTYQEKRLSRIPTKSFEL